MISKVCPFDLSRSLGRAFSHRERRPKRLAQNPHGLSREKQTASSLKFVRLNSQMTLLISKMCPFDSQMILLIYKTRRFVNPGVTSAFMWSARPNILLSERNNMTARDREGVPWEVVSLASYASIWCLSEVHIDGREKGT